MSPFEPLARFLSNHASQNIDETPLQFPWIVYSFVLISMFVVLPSKSATATNYYVSQTGNDTSQGTTQGSPWKTFGYAIPRLNPGDTLNLLDGTYTKSGNGSFLANCSSGAHNGTSVAHVTIQALNERQAFIRGDGSADSFEIANCSYWDVIGLHVESADSIVGNTFTGNVMNISSSSHITLRRNIVARNNRYGNTDTLLLYNTSNSLVEENEVYYFHRVGILNYGGSNNEIRRNYANSRGYGNISGGYPNGGTVYGIAVYSANYNTIENNIAENVAGCGFNNENTASNNKFLGNISGPNNSSCGFRTGPHAGQTQPTGNSWINNVAVRNPVVGFWNRGGNGTYDHDSAFGTSATTALFQSDTDEQIYPTYGHIVTNSTAQGALAGTAHVVVNTAGNAFRYDHDNTFSNATAYNPNSNITNPNTIKPTFGSCYLWVPDASPLKGAGSNSSDIGANIIFQYSGGVLTSNPLWDSTTGTPLFKGAIVAGLNDVPGSSLFDIANRLNINQNGCTFPTGTNVATDPAAPTGLTATVQ